MSILSLLDRLTAWREARRSAERSIAMPGSKKMIFLSCGLVAAPMLAACSPQAEGEPRAAALSPRASELLDKQLAGKVAGTPLQCLPNYRGHDMLRVSDDILLYRQGSNLVYRNNLRSSCPGLARQSDIMIVEQFGASTCAGDFFYLVDRISGIRGPTCVFGEFIPYRTPEDEAR